MSTDGYSTDESSKRKKDSQEFFDIFSKSRKISRTPDKGKQSEDKLEKIFQMMISLSEDIKEMKQEQKKYNEEILKLKVENENTKKENAELKKEINMINEKIDTMERERRKKNVIVQGLTINSTDQNTLKDTMNTFVKKELDIDINVRSARKLGQKTCLLELDNIDEKYRVMQNKSKLRNIRTERIYINDDMTKTERDIQGTIRKIAKQEKIKGKKVIIGYQKLVIDEQEWKWNKDRNEMQLITKDKNKQSQDQALKNYL